MNDAKLHKVLQDIERKANSDFALLEECGAEYFSTNDLLEMRGRLKEQMKLYVHFRRINSFIGASSPLWGVLAIGFEFLGWQILAIVASVLFPTSLLVFTGGYFFIKRQFNGRPYLEYISRTIERELVIRKTDIKESRGL